ncbi:MAG: NADPH:quinone reductase [Alphaproteobacteria bacterium]|nr:NADPH:quinone reductase [Alphaproteobacteria bacterium]MBM3733414.1 NADPH:quinone reductase [Acidimicrobiia bacterium]
MRAVWYERKGPAAEVLVAGEMPDPEPAPGEVRVRMAVSSVNPTDVKRRKEGRELGKFPRIVPNNDGAGTIDRVGAGVPQTSVGERVWVFGAQHGRPFGTAAQYTCVPARFAIPLPDGVSFADGASLGVPAVTAHRCLFPNGNSLSGQTVLVTGGTGRVGAYAIQMAKRDGALVIATASAPKLEQLKALGADVALDYRDPDLADRIKTASGGKGVHRIVETEFGANVALAPKILVPNGAIATYASDSAPEPKIPFGSLMVLNAKIEFVFIYGMPEAARGTAFADVTRMLKDGALRHRVGLRVPLARLAEAHAAVEGGTATGSVLVDVA